MPAADIVTETELQQLANFTGTQQQIGAETPQLEDLIQATGKEFLLTGKFKQRMIGGRPQAKILVNVVHQTGAILARRKEPWVEVAVPELAGH